MTDERVSPVVKKSNVLCRASWSPEAIWEARLVALVASRIHTKDKDFQTYEIPIMDILSDTNRGGEIYNTIDKATDYAMSRVLKLKNDHGGWAKYNLFAKCEYLPEKAVVTASFHPDLKPHYIELQKQFAKYDLTQFLMLPSTYSQRLFEILKSYDDLPEIILSLEDLHQMLSPPPSLKSIYKNFKRLVLVKAHTDIHKHTTLKYEWEPVKKGRKVVAVKFVFAKKRAQIVTKTKAQEKSQAKCRQQQKTSSIRTKLGVTASKCFESLGKVCTKEDPKTKDVCKICKELYPC